MSNDERLGARPEGGHRRGRRHGWGIAATMVLPVGLAAGLAMGLVPACYQGGERDKDPPPGLPGGLCLAPDGYCEAGTCNRNRNFCYDPIDPCDGFFCGGEERGVCFPDAEGQPSCQCNPGYTNEQYDLYCCPDASIGFDELCTQ